MKLRTLQHNLFWYWTQGWWDTPGIRVLCIPLSGVYKLLGFFRHLPYRLKLRQTQKSPIPLIIVGNRLVGGTGKTPLIMALANELRDQQKSVAICCKGYGGTLKGNYRVTEHHTQAQVGDEAWLYYQAGFTVYVARHLHKILPLVTDVSLLISDDGLQQPTVKPHLSVLVFPRQLPHNRYVLPVGPWREPHQVKPGEVVVSYGAPVPGALWVHKQPLPVLHSVSHPGTTLAVEQLAGHTVHAVCGIGYPEDFFGMLTNFGMNVVRHPFVDHATFTKADFVAMQGAPIIMTHKDAVKCTHLGLEKAWYLPIQVKVPQSLLTRINAVMEV